MRSSPWRSQQSASNRMICRSAGCSLVQRGERCRGLGNLARLVVRQGDVQPYVQIAGTALERFPVLGDGFLVATGARQRDAQIRAGVHRIGPELQVRPILRNRTLQLAGLVQRNRLLEDSLRIFLTDCREAEQHQDHYYARMYGRHQKP